MLLKHLKALNAQKIVLASASPQRLKILQGVGLCCEVAVSGFAEDLDQQGLTSVADYAVATARQKAVMVARARKDAFVVIGADTVVEVDGEVLEKPRDAAHAAEMLGKLSGRTHHVHTGVALVLPGEGSLDSRVITFHETTGVTFAALDADEIESYVASGEAFNKAGAYGIQGPAGAWVSGISGCYFNVVGFPVHKFAHVLVDSVADKLK